MWRSGRLVLSLHTSQGRWGGGRGHVQGCGLVDDPAALEQRLELLCNDKPLPMGMSLASVRAFVCTHGAYLLQLLPVLLLRTILAVL